ncbi:MAG TPA: alpha/beta hydrolase [Candidatus Binataceae bacterium]|jgi:pimeloyl-ACP methyl ester carboxylesterase|nr:alpha/beta hydrolase [Candidatus Binataceae bacterium]
MENRKFNGTGGIELNCVDYGGEGKPPMLLVHGGSAHARWWDFVAPALTDRFHVLALDQRGHGDSRWAADWAYGSRHYADDLDAVITDWGLGAPVLVGHSMGGHSVLVYAVEHSERLRAMVAIDSTPVYPEYAVEQLRAIAARPAPVYDSLQAAIAAFRTLPAETLASPEALRHVAALSFRQREDGKWVHKMDRRTLVREPIQLKMADLARIRCPALLIKPAGSPLLTPEFMQKMAERMARGRVVMVENSNHHVPIDNPKGLAAAMGPFLAEVLAAGAR